MNKKGFTLVELIAVIVIIAVVSLIATRVFTKKIEESKERAYNVQVANLTDASKKYMLEQASTKDPYHINTICVDVATLQKFGYIEKGEIKNPRTNKGWKDSIKIKYDNDKNQYDYTVSTNCEELTLNPIGKSIIEKENVKISGTDSGLYEENDEYIYKGISPNNYITFNGSSDWRIISIDKNTMSLKIVNLGGSSKTFSNNDIISALNEEYINGNIYTVETKKAIVSKGKFNRGKIDNLDTAISVKSLEKQINEYSTIGLVSIGEYIDASTNKECYKDNNCVSYFPTDNDKKFWLLNTNTSEEQWFVSNGKIEKTTTVSDKLYRVYPTLYLKADIILGSGDGTKEKPYTISIQ